MNRILRKPLLWIVCLSILVSGCSHTLSLTIRNPDKEHGYTIGYQAQEENAAPVYHDVASVPKEGGIEFSEDFKKDTTVTLRARLGSYIVWESPQYYMSKDRKGGEVYIDMSSIKRVDIAQSVKDLLEDDKKLAKVKVAEGYRPLVSVLNTEFGGFIACRRDNDSDCTGVVPPGAYGGVRDLNWIKANIGGSSVQIHRQYIMNKKATTDVSAGYAIFSTKVGYTDQDYYEYGLDIDIITMKHDETFATAKAKLSLSSDNVVKLANEKLDTYITNPRYKVFFVRGIHIVNQYKVSYKKGQLAETSAKIGVGSFLDGTVAFKLESTSISDDLYKDQVAGFLYEDSIDIAEIDPSKGLKLGPTLDRGLAASFLGTPKFLAVNDIIYPTFPNPTTKANASIDKYLLSADRDKR